MPLFEYRCPECHGEHEILVRGNQEPECPTCGSSTLEKRLSVPAAPAVATAAAPVGGCGVGPPCGRMGCGRRPN